MNNLICKCGHKFKSHSTDIGIKQGLVHCHDCKSPFGVFCCHMFVSDNLKFLEEQYEKEQSKAV